MAAMDIFNMIGETASLVGAELCMFIGASLVYVIFVGLPQKKGKSGKQFKSQDCAGVTATANPKSYTPRMRATMILGAASQGSLEKAMEQLIKLPDASKQDRCIVHSSCTAQLLVLAACEGKLPELLKELVRINAYLPMPSFREALQKMRPSVKVCKHLLEASFELGLSKFHQNSAYQVLADAMVSESDFSGMASLLKEFEENFKEMELDDVIALSFLTLCQASGSKGAELVPTVIRLHRSSCKRFTAPRRLLDMACGILLEVDSSKALDFYEREMLPLVIKKGGSWQGVDFRNKLLKVAQDQGRQRLYASLGDTTLAVEKAQLLVDVLNGGSSSAAKKDEEQLAVTINSTANEIQRVLSCIEARRKPVDDLLFHSIAENCVRNKKTYILSDFLLRNRRNGILNGIHSQQTYNKMMKVFAEAGNLKMVQDIWLLMQENKVKPTSGTIGCIVDALVINGHIEEAWEFMNQCGECKTLANTVVYTTVIKGFAASKQMGKITEVYTQMHARAIPCNLVTFNAILDACANSSCMDRATSLMKDMKQSDVEPDLITYSTLVKGYCNSGDLDRAFMVLEETKKNGRFLPDEVMYTCLLDGCHKQGCFDDAMKVYEDMKAAGLTPTKFTLCILVKLLGQHKNIQQMEQMVAEFKTKYNITPNIQVYTCMILASFKNKRLSKALAIYETAAAEGCRLDEKFYGTVARGCMLAKQPLKVIEVIRAAYKLTGTSLSLPAKAVGVEARALEEICTKYKDLMDSEKVAWTKLQDDLEAKGIRIGVRQQAGATDRLKPMSKWPRAVKSA
eukprot:TRINITY_DN3129_c0_g1_i3.p1 TRINITY_DN3129_c0_g1~~TRINITY_DN3129_c0_g1_i3.p1  ORF type:complete len:796 (-),score=202.08 TRINITY_DN3129_c0_g1_i3:501-2888(-)